MSKSKKQLRELPERVSAQLAMIDHLVTDIGKDSPVTLFILLMAKQNLLDEQGVKSSTIGNVLPKS